MSEMQQMVMNVIDVFEEVDRLRAEVARLSAAAAAGIEEGGPTTKTSPVDAYIYAEGRRKVLEDCYCSWKRSVRVSDEGIPTPYANWVRDAFDSVPDCMSRDQFVEAFDCELRARYADEVEKAMGD